MAFSLWHYYRISGGPLEQKTLKSVKLEATPIFADIFVQIQQALSANIAYLPLKACETKTLVLD